MASSNGYEIGTAWLRVKAKMDGNAERDLESAGGRAGKGFGGAFQVAMGTVLADVAEKAVTFIGGALKEAFSSYAEYEQLVGGVQKIFNDMDTQRIFADAQNAYKELNMSANDYMSTINQVGAAFSANMGDERAYAAARTGMMAIADYASGTGLNIDELNDKFRIISKSTQSYQAVCDQFSGILPQTSDEFLKQAQAAGYLSDEYTSLTEVPVGEYQEALVKMMAQGVEGLSLTGNTLHESSQTISGSLAALKAAWENFLVGIFDEDADMETLANNLITSLGWAFQNVMPALLQAASSLFSVIPQAFMSVLAEKFPGISEALGQIGEAFQPGIEAMQRIAQELAPMVGPALDTIGQTAQNVLFPALQRLGEAFSYLMIQLEPYAPFIMQKLVIAFEVLIGIVAAVIDIIAAFANIFGTCLEAANAFYSFIADMPSGIQGAFNSIKGFFDDLDQKVTDAMRNAWDSVSTWASNLKTNALDAVRNFDNSVHSAFLNVGNTIMNAMGNAQNAVSGAWANMVNTFDNAKSSVLSVVDNIGSSIGNIWSSVTNTFSNAANFIYGTLNNVVSFIWDAISSITNAFHSITIQWPHIPLPYFRWHWESVGGFFNIPWFDGIDWYAKGGFIDEATLIGAGERGGELIWPSYEPYLSQYADAIAGRIDSGMGGVDIHDNTFIVRREDDIKRVAVELNTLINRQTAGGIA